MGFFQFIGPASRCHNRLKAVVSFRQFEALVHESV